MIRPGGQSEDSLASDFRPLLMNGRTAVRSYKQCALLSQKLCCVPEYPKRERFGSLYRSISPLQCRSP